MRYIGHALEEVFESFWHLDGRIFRTLRDLVVPGRVAIGYIAGHRARYVAPLRLFVILSLLTFFVAQFSLEFDAENAIQIDPDTGINISKDDEADMASGAAAHRDIAKASTVAEVERIRDAELANIDRAVALIPKNIPAATVKLDIVRNSLQAQAKRRITELQAGPAVAEPGAAARAAIATATTVADVERIRNAELARIDRARALIAKNIPAGTVKLDIARNSLQADAKLRIAKLEAGADDAKRSTTPDSRVASGDKSAAAAARRSAGNAQPPKSDEKSEAVAADDVKNKPKIEPETAWDAKANPIAIPWLPAFANNWLNKQSDRASRNMMAIRDDPQRFVRVVISAIPSTLFVLVPVFALLLKIFYIFKRRLYLEHLVVALYSHAFLLLSLLGIFASMALRHGVGAQVPWLGTAFGWVEGLLWAWMPIYLLLMQKKVYRQGWWMTLFKYCVIGTVYFMLLTFGAVATFFYSLVRM